jgi:putative transposase
VPTADLAIMRRMDELHLEFPFAGSRMLRDLLTQAGIEIGRCHVATLMKRMGLEALYRKPNTSKPAPGHKIYPYLLRGVSVDRPNQVWAMDITNGPVAKFVSRPRSGRIGAVFRLGSPRKVRPRPPLSPPFSNFATGPV